MSLNPTRVICDMTKVVYPSAPPKPDNITIYVEIKKELKAPSSK